MMACNSTEVFLFNQAVDICSNYIFVFYTLLAVNVAPRNQTTAAWVSLVSTIPVYIAPTIEHHISYQLVSSKISAISCSVLV